MHTEFSTCRVPQTRIHTTYTKVNCELCLYGLNIVSMTHNKQFHMMRGNYMEAVIVKVSLKIFYKHNLRQNTNDQESIS
jgi:hypothetical protein